MQSQIEIKAITKPIWIWIRKARDSWNMWTKSVWVWISKFQNKQTKTLKINYFIWIGLWTYTKLDYKLVE